MKAIFIITLLTVSGSLNAETEANVKDAWHCKAVYSKALESAKDLVKEGNGFTGFKAGELKCVVSA